MAHEIERLPNESLLAFKGRQRRVRNAAVDMLGLKNGDPVMFNGRLRRFDSTRMKKTDPAYQNIARLDAEQTAQLEREENERAERNRCADEHVRKQEAFRARPEVRAAESIRCIIEMDLERIIDLLTPEEWQAFRAKLTGVRS